MKKSFLIIGMGRFGASVARTLSELEQEVMIVDKNEEFVSGLADVVTNALIADASEERVLQQLGVSNFDCVVIAMGDDLRASVLTTVVCKEQGAKKIVAKAYDSLHAKVLLKTGADVAILPERESGRRLAHSLVHTSVLEYIELSDTYSISEMRLPAQWAGKSLRELDVRAKYQVSILAVKRKGKLELTLDAGFFLHEGDLLVVLGENVHLSALEKI